MADTEYARMISKSSMGLPTVPPSLSHDNGDWSPNDIYEYELYFDDSTGLAYTRVGNVIVPINPPPVNIYNSDGTLTGNRSVNQNSLNLEFINGSKFSVQTGIAPPIGFSSVNLKGFGSSASDSLHVLKNGLDQKIEESFGNLTRKTFTENRIVSKLGNSISDEMLAVYSNDETIPYFSVRGSGRTFFNGNGDYAQTIGGRFGIIHSSSGNAGDYSINIRNQSGMKSTFQVESNEKVNMDLNTFNVTGQVNFAHPVAPPMGFSSFNIQGFGNTSSDSLVNIKNGLGQKSQEWFGDRSTFFSGKVNIGTDNPSFLTSIFTPTLGGIYVESPSTGARVLGASVGVQGEGNVGLRGVGGTIGVEGNGLYGGYFISSTSEASNFRAVMGLGGGYFESFGINGTPNSSAILEARSTTKGALLPQMSTSQKNLIASPATSLILFDSSLGEYHVNYPTIGFKPVDTYSVRSIDEAGVKVSGKKSHDISLEKPSGSSTMTIDITSLGLTSVSTVMVQAELNTSVIADMPIARLRSKSTTTIVVDFLESNSVMGLSIEGLAESTRACTLNLSIKGF